MDIKMLKLIFAGSEWNRLIADWQSLAKRVICVRLQYLILRC